MTELEAEIEFLLCMLTVKHERAIDRLEECGYDLRTNGLEGVEILSDDEETVEYSMPIFRTVDQYKRGL